MSPVRFTLLAGLLAITTGPLAAQAPADDAARVLGQWEQRHQTVQAVRYALEWELFPPNTKPGVPPNADMTFKGTGVLVLDFRGGRLRLDQDERMRLQNRREPLSRSRSTIRYDGTDQSTFLVLDFDAATSPAEPRIQTVDIGPWGSTMQWPNEFNPLLWGHGLYWTDHDPSDQFPLGWKAPPGLLSPRGREPVDGRDCLVFRSTSARDREVTLWVDAERGGAIVRQRVVDRNGAVGETTITYQQTPHGWLPHVWERTRTKPNEPPQLQHRTRITAFTVNPPLSDDEFRVALQPGMNVQRRGEYFTVAADGTLSPVEREGTPESFLGRLWYAVRGVRVWLGAGVALTVVLLGVLIALRRKKRTSPVT